MLLNRSPMACKLEFHPLISSPSMHWVLIEWKLVTLCSTMTSLSPPSSLLPLPSPHTHTITGYAEEPQLPYHDAVPVDPTFEDMKKVVVIDRRRPDIPNTWSQSEVGKIANICHLEHKYATFKLP